MSDARRWGLQAALLLAVACGGEAVVDQGGGGAGGATTSTSSGSSSSSSSGITDPGCTCPEQPPAAGSSCQCPSNSECVIDQCATMGTESIYGCLDGGWQLVSQQSCTMTVCPNGTFCDPDEVCLVTTWGFEAVFSCVPDPCAPSPLECGCASAACAQGTVCIWAGDGEISCDCPNC
jgi:hypothetical protein